MSAAAGTLEQELLAALIADLPAKGVRVGPYLVRRADDATRAEITAFELGRSLERAAAAVGLASVPTQAHTRRHLRLV